jgi:hypothetical protein
MPTQCPYWSSSQYHLTLADSIYRTHIDDLDSANMVLLALYVGVMAALLPPLLSETTATISSARLEMAGTLQVLVLVLCINF